jgi:dienelactone hydrolase
MANPLSRREVLKFGAYTSVGGVLTPGISLAQAIVTDTKGLTARDIELSTDVKAPAYEAHPEAHGRYPIVIAVSGFTGNSEHHKDVVRRFAKAGYYAIANRLTSSFDVEFVLYEGAPHAFFSDDRPQVYRKEAAQDAWRRILAFFDKYLKG